MRPNSLGPRLSQQPRLLQLPWLRGLCMFQHDQRGRCPWGAPESARTAPVGMGASASGCRLAHFPAHLTCGDQEGAAPFVGRAMADGSLALRPDGRQVQDPLLADLSTHDHRAGQRRPLAPTRRAHRRRREQRDAAVQRSVGLCRARAIDANPRMRRASALLVASRSGEEGRMLVSPVDAALAPIRRSPL